MPANYRLSVYCVIICGLCFLNVRLADTQYPAIKYNRHYPINISISPIMWRQYDVLHVYTCRLNNVAMWQGQMCTNFTLLSTVFNLSCTRYGIYSTITVLDRVWGNFVTLLYWHVLPCFCILFLICICVIVLRFSLVNW